MVKKMFGTYKIKFHPNQGDDPSGESDKLLGEAVEIDFTPPFKRVYLIEELENKLNFKLEEGFNFYTEEARQFFDDLCVKNNLPCSAPRTTARLLDKVILNCIK